MKYPEDFVNKIIHGNCLAVMPFIPDNSIDLTVTSPPYDNLRDYEGYDFDFKNIAKELYRVTKIGGIVVWVVSDQTKDFCETLTSFKHAIYFVEECSFKLLDTMIYEKINGSPPFPNMLKYPQWSEYMFILIKGKPKTFNAIRDRINKYSGWRHHLSTVRQKDGSMKKVKGWFREKRGLRSNVWKYRLGYMNDSQDKIAFKHPARFPEKLARDHIISWSNKGDLVLDPMVGSGTTCKMSKLLERNWIGIDVSENYCEIARKRVTQIDAIQLEFINMSSRL